MLNLFQFNNLEKIKQKYHSIEEEEEARRRMEERERKDTEEKDMGDTQGIEETQEIQKGDSPKSEDESTNKKRKKGGEI